MDSNAPTPTNHRFSTRVQGFTLVELLVAVSVIGVLAALLLPILSTTRLAANNLTCASNLRQLGMGIFAYAGDNNERYPGHNVTECGSWPYIFGDWSGLRNWRGKDSVFYQDYFPIGKKLFFCPTGLRSAPNEIRIGYDHFPDRGPLWIQVTNYCYFAGADEFGRNSRHGPRTTTEGTSQSTLLGDLMRFGGTTATRTTVSYWNHLGGSRGAGGVAQLTDRSGGHLLHADGHVAWISGLDTLLQNQQYMKNSSNRSYCAEQPTP
jgi:prepilin-type N-terminal cleavage/methylation domain-containing protein